jgi:dTDP-4-amino-4,6-dideoxygalactose transaminase
MIPIVRPLLGSEEQEAVLRVLVSGQLAQGEHVEPDTYSLDPELVEAALTPAPK